MRQKPVQVRQLRGGMWVVVAQDSEPLVTDRAIAAALRDPRGAEHASLLGTLTETLTAAGFMDVSGATSATPPAAPAGAGWRIARALLWAIGAVLFSASAVLLLEGGLPSGADAISASEHPVTVLAVAVGIAIATAAPHELAHVIFGRTLRRRRGSVRVRAGRASATTNLTHAWAWPSSPRLAAVSAGIVVDLVFLTAALAWRATTGSWGATVAVAVMAARVVWQLRFHRNCDGRHIAKMLIDSPTVDADTKRVLSTRRWMSAPRSTWLWLALASAGVLAELSLFAIWVVPAALRLAGLL